MVVPTSFIREAFLSLSEIKIKILKNERVNLDEKIKDRTGNKANNLLPTHRHREFAQNTEK